MTRKCSLEAGMTKRTHCSVNFYVCQDEMLAVNILQTTDTLTFKCFICAIVTFIQASNIKFTLHACVLTLISVGGGKVARRLPSQ